MNWKLNLHRARRAYLRDYSKRFVASVCSVGYDTASRITDYQEALVIGVGLLAAHGRHYDGKVVNDADWKGLK